MAASTSLLVQPIKMDGTKLKLNFWDLSGDDAYLEVRNEFYKDAQCVRNFRDCRQFQGSHAVE